MEKAGFTKPQYQGIDVVIRDYVPTGELWCGKNGVVTEKINLNTGEVTKMKVDIDYAIL